MPSFIGGALVLAGLAIAVYAMIPPGTKSRRENENASSVGIGVRPITPPARQGAVPGPRPSVREVRWFVPDGSLNLAYRPTWFACVPGRFVMGPYNERRSAGAAGGSPETVDDKIAIDPEQNSDLIKDLTLRPDLSAPPCYVFEFRCGEHVYFSALGPSGWVGPTTSSEITIRRFAAVFASSATAPNDVLGKEPDEP